MGVDCTFELNLPPGYSAALTGAKKEADRVVLASFPLHEYRALQELKRKWLVLFQWPHKQPFDEIKDYFGTKIALYYVWLGKYTTWLLYASVVGVICYMGVATDEGAYNSPMVAIFALFMCLWTTLFMESWKNTQERKKQKWNESPVADEKNYVMRVQSPKKSNENPVADDN